MARFLIVLGLAILVVGLLWPYLGKLGLGRLPGDIVIERESGTIHVPAGDLLVVEPAAELGVVGREPVTARPASRQRSRRAEFGRRLGITAGTAGCGWCAGRRGHAGRWNIARRGIPRPSTYSGCRPPQAKGARRARQQRPRPCAG